MVEPPKKYTANEKEYRNVAHHFADLIMETLTGYPGIFRTRMAYVAKSGVAKEIYTMGVDGTGVARLTSDHNINLSPDWSPNGAKIAFACYRIESGGGRWKMESGIHVMNTDGSGARRLTEGNRPYWSPDGTKILFFRSGDPPQRGWYVMNANGSRIRRLNREAALPKKDEPTFGTPCWSPDGFRLAFTALVDTYADDLALVPDMIEAYVFVINADGTGLHRVAHYRQQEIKSLDWR